MKVKLILWIWSENLVTQKVETLMGACVPNIDRNRWPNISPAKRSLFEISRELQFEVCATMGDYMQVPAQKGRSPTYSKEGKSGGWPWWTSSSGACHWLSPQRKERESVFFLWGRCRPPGGECPCWSQFYLIGISIDFLKFYWTSYFKKCFNWRIVAFTEFCGFMS